MSKQSSIDWFLSEFEKQIKFRPNSELDVWFKDLFPKAKEMHKQEIIEANRDGVDMVITEETYVTGEQYYNETYGGNNE
jgi:hypothetical protein